MPKNPGNPDTSLDGPLGMLTICIGSEPGDTACACKQPTLVSDIPEAPVEGLRPICPLTTTIGQIFVVAEAQIRSCVQFTHLINPLDWPDSLSL